MSFEMKIWKVLAWIFLLGFVDGVLSRKAMERERVEEIDYFRYNHSLAAILVQYASAVYVNDLDSLVAWNCSRCSDLTKGFQLTELIVDVQHCLQAEGHFEVAELNRQGTVHAQLQAYVGVAEDLNAIVVAFRGTQENSIQNWMEDLYFKQLDLNYPGVTGAMVHRGFYTAYHNTTLRGRVVGAIMSINDEVQGLDIIVTGHSMGGAMAAFCALDLVVNYGKIDVQVMTFGQPRIGNSIFAEYYSTLVPATSRITHEHDMVPHLPPYYLMSPQRTYHHFGRAVWIHTPIFGSSNHKIEQVCDGSGEDPLCSRSVSGNSITDHLCYLGVFLQADTWGSCTFFVRGNVLDRTSGGFIIQLPLSLATNASMREIRKLRVA